MSASSFRARELEALRMELRRELRREHGAARRADERTRDVRALLEGVVVAVDLLAVEGEHLLPTKGREAEGQGRGRG